MMPRNKKPKSGKSREHRYNIGCLTSSGLKNTSRVWNEIEINNIITNNAYDFTVNGNLGRKSCKNRLISFKSPIEKIKRRRINKKKKKVPQFVHLPNVYQHLYLSNIHFIEEYNKNPNVIPDQIRYIINLSDMKISSQHAQIINSVVIKRHKMGRIINGLFRKSARDITDFIKECSYKNYGVIVCCKTGCQESVAVIIGYAILNNIMTLDTCLDYIKQSKSDKYWNKPLNQHLICLLEK